MKRFMKSIMSVAFVATVLFSGCTKPEGEVTPKNPTIAIKTIDADAGQTVVTVTVADADQVFYTYYVKDARPATPAFDTKAVSADGDVEITLSGFDTIADAETLTFVVEAYASRTEKDKNYTSEPVTEEFTVLPAPKLSFVSIEAGATSAVITLDAKNVATLRYAFYPKGARPATVDYTSFDIKADGELSVSVKYDYDFNKTSDYTFEAVASNVVDGQTLSTDVLTQDFTTAQAQFVNINSIHAAPKMITVDVEFLECDAYVMQCYEVGDSYMTYDEFLAKMMYAYNPTHKEAACKIKELKPEQAYVIAYIGVNLKTDQYGSKIIGEFKSAQPLTIELTTPKFEFNKCDAVATFGKVTAAPYQLSVEVQRGEATNEFYEGAIRKSDLGEQSIEEYLTAWLNSSRYGKPMYNQIGTTPFKVLDDYGEYVDVDSYKLIKSTIDIEDNNGPIAMEPATDYVIWTIGVSPKGDLGKVSTIESATSELSFDSAAKVDILTSISKNGQTAYFVPTLKSDCVKFAYAYDHAEYITPENEMTKRLIGQMSSNEQVSKGAQFSFEYLSPNTDYILYILPIDSKGKYGQLQKIEFCTTVKGLDFSGRATLTATIAEAKYDVVINGTRQTAYKVNITKGDYCDGFAYQYNDSDQFGTSVTVEDFGNYIMIGDFKETTINSTDNVVEAPIFCWWVGFGLDKILIVIPYETVNEQPVYGAPVRLDLPYNNPSL